MRWLAVETRNAGVETDTTFLLESASDCQKVFAWYDEKLKVSGFKDANLTIVGSTVFDSSMAKLTAQDATGRSILNVRMEPAGGKKVVAIEAREGVR